MPKQATRGVPGHEKPAIALATSELEGVKASKTATPVACPISTTSKPMRQWASVSRLAAGVVLTLVACGSLNEVGPAPTTPPLGRDVGAVALGQMPDAVRAALGEPTAVGLTRGVGSPEWTYAGTYLIRFEGRAEAPGESWGIFAYAASNARTREGFGIGDDKAKFASTFSGYTVRTFSGTSPSGTPMDQHEVSDGTTVVLVEFAPASRATYINISVAGR